MRTSRSTFLSARRASALSVLSSARGNPESFEGRLGQSNGMARLYRNQVTHYSRRARRVSSSPLPKLSPPLLLHTPSSCRRRKSLGAGDHTALETRLLPAGRYGLTRGPQAAGPDGEVNWRESILRPSPAKVSSSSLLVSSAAGTIGGPTRRIRCPIPQQTHQCTLRRQPSRGDHGSATYTRRQAKQATARVQSAHSLCSSAAPPTPLSALQDPNG